MTRHSLAIDIGGTFTDAVLLSSDGQSYVDKTLTTHNDLLEGFFRGVELVTARAGIAPQDVDDVVVHATTVVTNALIVRARRLQCCSPKGSATCSTSAKSTAMTCTTRRSSSLNR